MTLHVLKTWPEPFAALLDGTKTAEFRRDDRGFQVGDELLLREFDPGAITAAQIYDLSAGYSGREIKRLVSHVVRGPAFGVPDGFAVLSLAVRACYCCTESCQAGCECERRSLR